MSASTDTLGRRTPAANGQSRPPSPRKRSNAYLWFGAAVIIAATGFFWFTSARILSKAVELSYGPADPAFSHTLGPLLGADFSPDNSVEVLLNGDGIFPPMLDAIRAAKKSITLETYIWAPGQISDRFIAALVERARNGVHVKILVDGMGTLKFKREDGAILRDAGVEFVTYGRKHWYEIKPNINHRTHRKILVVDGKVGFTGGMCIDDKWSGNGDTKDVWRDTGVKVQGPVVRELQATFAANWLQTTGELITGPDYFPPLPPVGPSLAQCYKSGPGENAENARISYLLAIASARKSIRIAHAYFVPDDLANTMLLAAIRRGVTIDVIVPAINDSRFGRAASRSRWGPLLAAGANFHQFLPALFHTKIMIVDDTFVTVGSVNFDNRSFAINDEMNLNVIDPGVAQAFLRSFEQDTINSKPLTREEFEGRSFLIKGVDWFCGLFRSQL
ncbi:phospholipase D-like domain-containing protein [Horticoccus sp. 23ND18S-11]|uniref:phospholipase D-like domain-containing protein n=1 Tax=Horticoccus sp. 23ND18S-11 TaxID=3391832 RepID=UPI0039C8F771